MGDSPKVVLCNECKMWFDAQLSACPSCEYVRPDENKALVTARLNGALATQVGHAKAEAAAQRQFDTAWRTGNADLANRRPAGYPNYDSLVSRIKAHVKDAGIGS